MSRSHAFFVGAWYDSGVNRRIRRTMITQSLRSSCFVASLAIAIGMLSVAGSAYAVGAQRPVQVILTDTGKTVAVPVGQDMVVSLPLSSHTDDSWYVAKNTGGLKLIAGPNERRPRNWAPWGYSRQEFYFRRESPGPAHLVLERRYFSKPLVLEVVDP